MDFLSSLVEMEERIQEGKSTSRYQSTILCGAVTQGFISKWHVFVFFQLRLQSLSQLLDSGLHDESLTCSYTNSSTNKACKTDVRKKKKIHIKISRNRKTLQFKDILLIIILYCTGS